MHRAVFLISDDLDEPNGHDLVTQPVYAGVIVVTRAPMARKLSAELAVPQEIIGCLEGDLNAGMDVACDLISQLQESGVSYGCQAHSAASI